MAKNSLSLAMSQIIACDAPLLSPLSDQHHWDLQQPLFSPTNDSFNYGYYNLPPSPPDSTGSQGPHSPPLASRMLKMRSSDNAYSDADQLCLPTHQLFELPDLARPPTPPSRSPSIAVEPMHHDHPSSTDDSASVGAKRSASPAPSVNKKRAIGERISSKDFVPPDVSGLSKREARLVKNRAAAFLSRQRKREEFECMEVRVAELEQENARLLALTQNGTSTSPQPASQSDPELVSEVEQLRAQLALAQERERSLSAQLSSSPSHIKVESTEPQFSLTSPSRSSTVSLANKSGASFGLMVLLCALPSLLSMRMQPAAPTSFSIPNPFPASSSAIDYNSMFSNDYDWSKTTNSGSMMDNYNPSSVRKLEFAGTDSTELGGLGDLDISFDASPSDDGKIRVRILPPSTASSRSASPGSSPSDLPSSSLAMWSGSSSDRSSFSSQSSSSSADPFLGVSSGDYLPFASDGSFNFMNDLASSLNFGQASESTFGSEYNIPDSTGAKRRVRIALKSMPQAGGEGGEWEVQLC